MSLLDGLITVDPCDTAWETTFAKNGSDAYDEKSQAQSFQTLRSSNDRRRVVIQIVSVREWLWRKGLAVCVFSLVALGFSMLMSGCETLRRNQARYVMLKALDGDAEYQNTLGSYYLLGYGVGRDPSKAVYWYRLAAEQGYTLAKLNLGGLLVTGKHDIQFCSNNQRIKDSCLLRQGR